ncbi:MAG: hypothetical protein WAQ25_03800 [Candidatus Saccharimonas sp.]
MRIVRGKIYVLSLILVVASIASVFRAPDAQAAQITARTLTLVGVTGVGGSMPGGTVNHKFTFSIPTTTSPLGSIKFEYCTVASKDACVTPTGMDASTVSGLVDTGSAVTGWTINSSTTNSVVVKRAAASNPAGSAMIIQLNAIKNPTPVNYTFFVRISTYASLDGTGTATDTGSVAASTATAIQLSGIMPESLIFCTGGNITVTSNVPDCSTATSGIVEFNQLFSPQDTAIAMSQMAASTNAFSGYAITVNGPTLTSGSSTIPAMAPGAADNPIARAVGTNQFGMNLRANTAAAGISFPGLSADVTPAPNGTGLRGQPAADYNVQNNFKYSDGDIVAASDNGGLGPTNSQLYTVSYIANVAGNLTAGTYSTTLTYICTPTF